MTLIEIPTLTTERLTLRAPSPSDFEPVAAFYASERSSMVGGPRDPIEAWRTLAGVVGHWHLRGFGRWTVVEDGAPMGIVGLRWPEDWPEDWPEPEVGWLLFEGAEGRGVAREAAEAARAYAYHRQGWRTLISLIDPINARSVALAERMGARREADFAHPTFGALGVWRHPGPAAAGPPA